MDGNPCQLQAQPRVERSFEVSRLSSQFARLAYQQAVAIGGSELKGCGQDACGVRSCESTGTHHAEHRWAAGG